MIYLFGSLVLTIGGPLLVYFFCRKKAIHDMNDCWFRFRDPCGCMDASTQFDKVQKSKKLYSVEMRREGLPPLILYHQAAIAALERYIHRTRNNLTALDKQVQLVQSKKADAKFPEEHHKEIRRLVFAQAHASSELDALERELDHLRSKMKQKPVIRMDKAIPISVS